MQHEAKKITRIVDELLTLLLLNESNEIDIKIQKQNQETEITMIQHQYSHDQRLIEQLRFNLNAPRQKEVEGYYWQLAGENASSDGLYLVGTMVDQATVEERGEDLFIHLVRKA
ncbi:MAG: hypothetical protein LLG09_07730 [Negativicutes bacterium]|nr:hypothetical protein [Negativicutes bacterium]